MGSPPVSAQVKAFPGSVQLARSWSAPLAVSALDSAGACDQLGPAARPTRRASWVRSPRSALLARVSGPVSALAVSGTTAPACSAPLFDRCIYQQEPVVSHNRSRSARRECEHHPSNATGRTCIRRLAPGRQLLGFPAFEINHQALRERLEGDRPILIIFSPGCPRSCRWWVVRQRSGYSPRATAARSAPPKLSVAIGTSTWALPQAAPGGRKKTRCGRHQGHTAPPWVRLRHSFRWGQALAEADRLLCPGCCPASTRRPARSGRRVGRTRRIFTRIPAGSSGQRMHMESRTARPCPESGSGEQVGAMLILPLPGPSPRAAMGNTSVARPGSARAPATGSTAEKPDRGASSAVSATGGASVAGGHQSVRGRNQTGQAAPQAGC